MIDYKLTRAEQIVLNALDVRDPKIVNKLRIELKMGSHTIKKTLMALRRKELADYTQDRQIMYWVAL